MTIDVLILVLTLSVYGLALVAFALTGYFVWKTQHIEEMHSMLIASDEMFKRLEEKRAERIKARSTQ